MNYGDIMQQKLYKLNYYALMICILVFPIGMLIRYTALYFGLDNIFWNINLLRLYWFILPIQGFIYIYSLYKRIIKPNYFDYIIYGLILAGVISSLFAMDYYTSIFGYIKRYEGLIAIISYYLIFLNSRLVDKERRYKLLNILIIVGLCQSIYAVLQVIFKVPFVMKFKWTWMASGLNSNPNFFGSYMVILGLLSIGMYLFYNKHRIFYFICSLIFLISLILAQSTGPLIGYFFGILVLLIIVLIKKIKIWKELVILGIGLLVSFFVSVYGTDYIFNNVYHYKNMDSYTIKGDIDRILIYGCDLLDLECKFIKEKSHLQDKEDITLNQISSNRFTIWKESLPIIRDNFLVGVGLDNFGIAYEKYYKDNSIDKVHNAYLQILVTNGIIGFIPYILWLALVIYKGFKVRNIEIIILLIPIIGYSFQAIFNISVVDVAPVFYLLCGLNVGFKEE